jgi:hypothetical protein
MCLCVHLPCLCACHLIVTTQSADGRAVMRSSIREFIASEAMEALGVSERDTETEGLGSGLKGLVLVAGCQLGGVVCRALTMPLLSRCCVTQSIPQVPTTRALCCIGTGDQVLRDMFYDGRAQVWCVAQRLVCFKG